MSVHSLFIYLFIYFLLFFFVSQSRTAERGSLLGKMVTDRREYSIGLERHAKFAHLLICAIWD